MTHPNRQELAGRLDKAAGEISLYSQAVWVGAHATEHAAMLKEAAAALRQSPSVEEVHDAILTSLFGPCDQISDERDAAIFEAAQAIDALYQRGGGDE